jgi:Protein of unknown function (DUF1364)
MMFPKSPRQENPALLKLAQGKPCLMQVNYECLGADGHTTVAAHSNEQRHGKGRGIKAHDQYTVWSCIYCHAWYDQGKATREEKRAAFETAHTRQVQAWRQIVETVSPKERGAAQWALDRIEKTLEKAAA